MHTCNQSKYSRGEGGGEGEGRDEGEALNS